MIQNNVNRVLKLLAAITIILSVPTMIASIYRMIVPLPFQNKLYAFWLVISIIFAMTGLFAFVFYKKHYFTH
ncbi:CorA family divalent cation transporter [Aneurinibacillus aneurinilyticus]|uniref:Uncharacterized protein n=2 Tax=Aneurinibacillus aneurinilyticus TaxID=1391 RepID=A0A848CU38_ANEAE|nr:CorA family divalent cation transporter [Aneurinibacillus aneurinilyticus]ERI07450.1 hypothetical protein HMPREF0083_04475 [Aneurinibacillus aneurinilyticus ATCC 12856]MCI1695825.1 hypothetical protein [Aneurinibacillus aneurinilyticus]MED0670993.1 CorA family divalent cation transporter [Aneurinibacillus aneurinilyticus]MED0704749.1 CorA family divalent cation transporter [Aneurinibacillus aneurinilyticus]MED0722648.1 CorA family divalent cation transporter [Aneurinibacillus aneurinilyticu